MCFVGFGDLAMKKPRVAWRRNGVQSQQAFPPDGTVATTIITEVPKKRMGESCVNDSNAGR
jgi:hypothetical protein